MSVFSKKYKLKESLQLVPQFVSWRMPDSHFVLTNLVNQNPNSTKMTKKYNILFLCTGNSARSILGEVLATTLSQGRFVGYSAGSHPRKYVHPIALRIARNIGYPLELLRSKSWDEFGVEGAPHMDFIITVCDSVAGEECPYWPGHPATAHWGFPDPAAVDAGEAAMLHAFQQVEMGLRNRIELLMDLPIDKLDQLHVKEELQSIHHRLKFR